MQKTAALQKNYSQVLDKILKDIEELKNCREDQRSERVLALKKKIDFLWRSNLFSLDNSFNLFL